MMGTFVLGCSMRHELHLSHFGGFMGDGSMSDSEKENGVQYFEGVEKLLEVWFKKSDGDTKLCDLRKIPRQKWEGLLKIVRCEIISFVRNDHVDAYVLSESSMFVAHRRFILKTCGNTTPLLCLKPLLLLVEQYAGYDEVEDVFYSRKNFKRPDLQMAPHHSFEEEVALLDTFFNDGAAYCLGTINRDCWYLYTLNRIQHNNQNKLCCGLPKSIEEGLHEPDQTLEILMSDLDQRVMNVFTKEVSSTAAEATQKSGIDKLMPNMVIDDFLFEPCGYSMNGISKNDGPDLASGCYMTIHITPEPEFSYVSFESNVPQSSYKEVISRVLETFQPGKFVLTVFANKTSIAAETPRELESIASFGPWMRHEIQYCRFKNYDLTYAFYSKFPS